jgi:hypothetical protein
MELWEDFQTSGYFLLDVQNGFQTGCNKYGATPISFKPYTSGFSQSREALSLLADSNYRVQPKKFDGYFQCPRPSSHVAGVRRPYTSDNRRFTAKRLPDDVSRLPKPVSSLGFSNVYDKTHKSPLHVAQTAPQFVPDTQPTSIDAIKKSLEPAPKRDVKTAESFFHRLKHEKETAKGYQAPEKKTTRRKMKGFFLFEFPTSSQLVKKEKAMLELTNPVAVEKQRRLDSIDTKNLLQRREQRILKNKLMQA